jgi:hypothetical protein
MLGNARIKPSATTLTTLFTASADCVVSSIVVCNTGTASDFRIAIRPLGASIQDEHYIYYDLPIDANDTFIATIGISLLDTDVVSVYSTSGNVTFNLFYTT